MDAEVPIGTKYLKLKISMGDLGILKWYVDGLHNTHWDCKGMEEQCSQWTRKQQVATHKK